MTGSSEKAAIVKEYILTEFLQGTSPSELRNDTPLVTGGVLDSLATVRLVAFLEERFGIEIRPHETSVDYLDTIDLIASLVESKLA
jgi:acyl carrier protein